MSKTVLVVFKNGKSISDSGLGLVNVSHPYSGGRSITVETTYGKYTIPDAEDVLYVAELEDRPSQGGVNITIEP